MQAPKLRIVSESVMGRNGEKVPGRPEDSWLLVERAALLAKLWETGKEHKIVRHRNRVAANE